MLNHFSIKVKAIFKFYNEFWIADMTYLTKKLFFEIFSEITVFVRMNPY